MTERRKSFIETADRPGAVISDGLLFRVPLWAVTSMTLRESYHLPALGRHSGSALTATHEDTLTLSGLLVGEDRFVSKFALETMAEGAMLGSLAQTATGGRVAGLILITSMTVRTDIYVQDLSFSVDARRTDVISVNLSLLHLPRPSGLPKLIDALTPAVSALSAVW